LGLLFGEWPKTDQGPLKITTEGVIRFVFEPMTPFLF